MTQVNSLDFLFASYNPLGVGEAGSLGMSMGEDKRNLEKSLLSLDKRSRKVSLARQKTSRE